MAGQPKLPNSPSKPNTGNTNKAGTVRVSNVEPEEAFISADQDIGPNNWDLTYTPNSADPQTYTFRIDDEVGAAKGGMTEYETALAGGKHSGFLKNYLGRSADEINKAINTLQTGKRGINTHLDKIANPSKYVPNWNTLRPNHQQSLINGWQKEITNGTEQIQILKGLLGN